MYVFPSSSSSPQRERRTIKKNFRGGFLNFIKQNYTDFEEERLRDSFVYVFTITSSSSTIDHREKNFFFREIKN
jgi:hypothetical protein